MKVTINKSSRHSKITGDAAERLVLYWLSKYGFECAYVDHVGIDIIAKNPNTHELMGISVKSRSRTEKRENAYVSIPNDNLDKIEFACKAFGCKPYFAILVDANSKILIFILSKSKLLKLFPKRKSNVAWPMNAQQLEQYRTDKDIKMIELDYNVVSWWKPAANVT